MITDTELNTYEPLTEVALKHLIEMAKGGGIVVKGPCLLAILAELRASREIIAKLPSELRKWWRFTESQQPMSSWHDREDFIEDWNRRCAALASKVQP